MGDMDRTTLCRFVYRRLADPLFRERLTAAADDGSRPLIFCLPDDSLRLLVERVKGYGGAANVFVATAPGVLGIDFRASDEKAVPTRAPRLNEACTVGLFVERLRIDASGTGRSVYKFAVASDDSVDSGTAKVVALAG